MTGQFVALTALILSISFFVSGAVIDATKEKAETITNSIAPEQSGDDFDAKWVTIP